jgi:molecular chaperone DnaK
MESRPEVIIGIDLGTTNSEVAVYAEDTVTVIEGEDGKLLPSYVGLDDNGRLLVGAPALNQYVLHPDRTIKSIKRLMGQAEQVKLGEKSYSPQEISAMMLRRLRQIAETHLGHSIDKAVITVPAFFSDHQRQATREAGKIAGLEVVRIINEPTAATLVYESSHDGSKKVLVYDLGGGTFDVSLVEIQDDVVEVLASHGNNQLGGDDFDGLIENYVVEKLREDGLVDIALQARARIRRAAENAKKHLSSQPFVLIEEEYLLDQDGVPYHLRVELARADYEEMIEPLVDETLDAAHLVLKNSGITATEVEEILLVGGSTHTPLVQRKLEENFGMAPRFEMDPDLCVAAGAALQAAMIGGSDIRAVLIDVTPYTFGISAIGEVDGILSYDKFVPIIRKNTPIPVTRGEVFYTVIDDQEVVEVKVFQGECEDARDNVEVGRFVVEGLGKYPASNEILAQFALDADGILQVSATEKATGLAKSITIHNALTEGSEQSLAKARDNIRQLFGDDSNALERESRTPSTAEQVPVRSEGADNLFVEAGVLMEKGRNLLDTVGDDDKEDIIELLSAMNNAIAGHDIEDLGKHMDELSEIIFYLDS